MVSFHFENNLSVERLGDAYRYRTYFKSRKIWDFFWFLDFTSLKIHIKIPEKPGWANPSNIIASPLVTYYSICERKIKQFYIFQPVQTRFGQRAKGKNNLDNHTIFRSLLTLINQIKIMCKKHENANRKKPTKDLHIFTNILSKHSNDSRAIFTIYTYEVLNVKDIKILCFRLKEITLVL